MKIFEFNNKTPCTNQILFLTGLMCTLWSLCVLTLIDIRPNTEKLSQFQIFMLSAKLLAARSIIISILGVLLNGIELSFIYHDEDQGELMLYASGLMLALGQVIGGIMFGMVAKNIGSEKTTRLISIIGGTVFCLVLFVILSNLMRTPTYQDVVLRIVVSLSGSLFLGYSDSAFVTQIYDILGSFFDNRSNSELTVLRFVPCITSALVSVYSTIGVNRIIGVVVVCPAFGFIICCIHVFARMRKDIDVKILDTNKHSA